MLDHDGYVADDHAGERRAVRDRFEVLEIIEAQVEALSRRDVDSVRSNGSLNS